MFLSTLDFFGETHTPVVVDSTGIDVSEFEQEEDKNFLVEKGTELLRIDVKAEDAKAKIVKAIDDRAEDAKGKIVYEIQEEFRNNPEKKGGLLRYFHSLGYWSVDMEKMGLTKPDVVKATMWAVFNWANAYRGAKDIAEQLGDSYTQEQIQEKIAQHSPSVLAKMMTRLSTEDRKEMYESSGPLTYKEAVAETQKPERQINRVKEDLQVATQEAAEKDEEWEETKANPDIQSDSKEYKKSIHEKQNADTKVANLAKKLKDLEEKIKTQDEASTKTITKLQSEVDRLNAPEEEKKQRMLATSNALIATLPNVHSHLQRFYTDIQHYDQDTVLVLEEHIKLVKSLIEAHL